MTKQQQLAELLATIDTGLPRYRGLFIKPVTDAEVREAQQFIESGRRTETSQGTIFTFGNEA